VDLRAALGMLWFFFYPCLYFTGEDLIFFFFDPVTLEARVLFLFAIGFQELQQDQKRK